MRSHLLACVYACASCIALSVVGCAVDTAPSPSREAVGASSEPLVAITERTNFGQVQGVMLVSTAAADDKPLDAECRAAYSVPCYSPQEIRNAYGITPFIDAGYDGKGQTIVIIDPFGSPTIEADLKQFDADFGIPDPPSFTILAPLGPSPPFDRKAPHMAEWAWETTIDVEWAHATAPGASIVLLTSPVAETQGITGMPELLALEKYAVDHHLGKIISQSFLATENTLMDAPGRALIEDFEAFFRRAKREHVTFLAAAGDWGATNHEIDDTTFYPYSTVGYPASSPNVTAIGGTSLHADLNGTWQSEVTWNGHGYATGGGVSQVFDEPIWQWGLPQSSQKILAGHRGIPDVAYNADSWTGITVYFSAPGYVPAYYFVGGTSEGAPQWAGIVAILNQVAGRPLGFLNDKLYLLGELGLLSSTFHDVTSGNNTLHGVTGYDAEVGWDAVTGWGTPNLGALGQLLAALPDSD